MIRNNQVDERRHIVALRCCVFFLLLLSCRPAFSSPDNQVENFEGLDDGIVEKVDLYAIDSVPRKIMKVIFRASALSKRGEYERVVDLLRNHLADHPDQDHYLIRLDLGAAYGKLADNAAAATQYRLAVAMEPELDRGWIGLGDVTYKSKDFLESSAAFSRGFLTSPERPVTVLYSAAAAALQGGDASTALEYFLELESGRWGDMKFEWYRGLAAAALQSADFSLAEPALDRMLQRYFDEAESWFLMYQFAASQEQYEEAAIALTVTGYLRSLSQEEDDQLGDLFRLIGVPALSVDRYENALAKDANPERFEKLVSACLEAHDNAAALRFLNKALAHGGTPRLYALLGDVHYRNKNYEAARRAFFEVLKLDDDYTRAYLMVGYCSVELGEKEPALDYLGRVVSDAEYGSIANVLIQRAMRMTAEESS